MAEKPLGIPASKNIAILKWKPCIREKINDLLTFLSTFCNRLYEWLTDTKHPFLKWWWIVSPFTYIFLSFLYHRQNFDQTWLLVPRPVFYKKTPGSSVVFVLLIFLWFSSALCFFSLCIRAVSLDVHSWLPFRLSLTFIYE